MYCAVQKTSPSGERPIPFQAGRQCAEVFRCIWRVESVGSRRNASAWMNSANRLPCALGLVTTKVTSAAGLASVWRAQGGEENVF